MLFERIISEGLSHYSYLIGDGKDAVVIDPRRDCEIYITKAHKQGMRIRYILETHRNEDYVTGSVELASRIQTEIWHADSHLDYQYGEPIEDGQIWKIGRLKLKSIHTPGHTLGSISYLLYDPSGAPWMVFTGDVLFAGDVGRVDLMGIGRIREMAGLLYDSIFGKLLPLGDSLIICPAHGSGSVCGSAISERIWTTIGLERENNARLQYTDRPDFIENVAKELETPPYFIQMEALNVDAPPILGRLPIPSPLSPEAFEKKINDSIVIDTRTEVAFSASHVSRALSIWLEGLPNFAGWFIPYHRPILLVNESNNSELATRYLIRLGFDMVDGFLSWGMLSWHMSGRRSESIRIVTVQELCNLLDKHTKLWILDIRSKEEIKSTTSIPGSENIPLAQLSENLEKIPKDRAIHIFCGSGMRSMIAASLLQSEGWKELFVILGGLSGWNSITCPIEM